MFSKIENKTASVHRLGFIAYSVCSHVGYSPIHCDVKSITRSNWQRKRLSDIKSRTMQVVLNNILLLIQTSPILPTYHRLDTRAELTCSFSFYYGSKQRMFYLSLYTDADRGKSHNLLKLYHKTLYEGKYKVRSCISSR